MSQRQAFANKYIPLAEKACTYLTASPDPFHAVYNSIQRLKSEGFEYLSSSEPLTGKLVPGGKYYYTVEHSTLVAFAIGPKYQHGQPVPFHMIGGHTDSPNLKVKPHSKRSGGASNCKLLGVECYGGGLWHTWFDRDLGISGRVMIRKKNDGNDDGKIQQRLVKIDEPIARISNLAIHLQSGDERKAFAVNKENHTAPIIATNNIVSPANDAAKTKLEEGVAAQLNNGSTDIMASWRDGHEPLLLQLIAEKLDVNVDEIIDFELNLFDTQPATIGGIGKEFIYSGRLDNLATVFCAVEALSEYVTMKNFIDTSADVSLIVAFDHEEVGSTSSQGAGSTVMQDAVQRIAAALNGCTVSPDIYTAGIRKSFVLSIDQAHAIHPNYASKHEAAHAPKLNGGVVIKTNSNQRYATNGLTGFVVRELGRLAGTGHDGNDDTTSNSVVPIQEFVVRNDCPCGSTIGPTISSKTGIRVVDAGMPQLSMHSCREVMGIADCKKKKSFLNCFFDFVFVSSSLTFFFLFFRSLFPLCKILLLLLFVNIHIAMYFSFHYYYYLKKTKSNTWIRII